MISSLLAIAGSSFLLGLSGACMPGPLLTVTVAETTRRGPWAGPLLVAGHAVLEILVVLLVILGFGELLTNSYVFVTIAFVGALLLCWMSYGMLRSLPRLSLVLDESEAGQGRMHPCLSGALVSVANPYFTLWWATIGLTYLLIAGQVGWSGVVVFYVFHILADLAWYAFISVSVYFGRNLFSDRSYRALVAACAVFLVGFAFYFVYAGVNRIPGLN